MPSATQVLNEVVLESFEDSDIDEFEVADADELESENMFEWESDFYDDEFELGASGEFEFDDEGNEFEDEFEYEFEYENPGGAWPGGMSGARLSESEVEALASDLMSLQTGEEAEEFLGKIFKGAKKLVKFAKPLLASAAPLVGAGLGSIIPGAGTALGGIAGKALGAALGGNGGRRGRGRRRRGRRGRRRGGFNFGRALGGFLGRGGNPLSAILQSGLGKGILGRLMGREMEAMPHGEVQFQLAKNVVRTLDDFAGEMEMQGELEHGFFDVATSAMSRAVNRNIPVGVRPALIATKAR